MANLIPSEASSGTSLFSQLILKIISSLSLSINPTPEIVLPLSRSSDCVPNLNKIMP